MTYIDISAAETIIVYHQIRGGRRRQTTSTGARPAHSNSAVALKLLTRSRGATILQLATATGWQSHSVRAHLSRLRKKGVKLLREISRTGEGTYRVANAGVADHRLQSRKLLNPADAVRVADVADAVIATTSTTAAA